MYVMVTMSGCHSNNIVKTTRWSEVVYPHGKQTDLNGSEWACVYVCGPSVLFLIGNIALLHIHTGIINNCH